MNTNIHFRSYIAQFFLEWEMFQTEFVDKIKTHILGSITCLSKIVQFMKQCGKVLYSRTGHSRQYNMVHAHACWIIKAPHTHTHTHTHSANVILIAFPLQKWLHERDSVLRYA